MINYHHQLIVMIILTDIISSGSMSNYDDSSEAILNWESPPHTRKDQRQIENFVDEDELLLKHLSKAVPGTYHYKPSTSLQLVRPQLLDQRYDDDEGSDDSDDQNDSGETLAAHLTKLASSSSNNNYRSSDLLSSFNGGHNSYKPMDIVPLEYLKYLKELDNVDPQTLNRQRKKSKSSDSDQRKLPLTDGKRKRTRNKNKSKVPKKSYIDDDEIIPENGSEVNSHKNLGNNNFCYE